MQICDSSPRGPLALIDSISAVPSPSHRLGNKRKRNRCLHLKILPAIQSYFPAPSQTSPICPQNLYLLISSETSDAWNCSSVICICLLSKGWTGKHICDIRLQNNSIFLQYQQYPFWNGSHDARSGLLILHRTLSAPFNSGLNFPPKPWFKVKSLLCIQAKGFRLQKIIVLSTNNKRKLNVGY